MNQRTKHWLNKEEQLVIDKKVHYFVSSVTTWSIDEDMQKAITKHKKATNHERTPRWVFIVPKPIDTNYEIDMYQPVGVDAHLVAELTYGR
jgi:adenosyl cobinamide kinase/adenosyl cobinamide phosphate guanylyltransferase